MQAQMKTKTLLTEPQKGNVIQHELRVYSCWRCWCRCRTCCWYIYRVVGQVIIKILMDEYISHSQLPAIKNKIIWDECSTGHQTIILGLLIFLEQWSSRTIDQKFVMTYPTPLVPPCPLFCLSLFPVLGLFVFQPFCLCSFLSLLILVYLNSS